METAEMPIVKKIREIEQALLSSVVVVGWIDGSGALQTAQANLKVREMTGKQTKASAKPVSRALIAATLNYGRAAGTTLGGRSYPEIPARQFMKFAAEMWEREFPKVLKKFLPSVLGGTMSIDEFLTEIGKRARDAVKKAISDGDYAPLAPSTIAAKGSSTPLIDTGTMMRSVTFEVRRG